MLIVRRLPGEAVLIDETIKVTVLPPDELGVRLGIEAPEEMTVVREEVHHILLRAAAKLNPAQEESEKNHK